MRGPIKWAARFLALGALGAAAFLVVGLLLPGRAEVVRSVEIDAAPEDVFPLVADLDAWLAWTPWGEVESRVEGRSSGVGARRVWDDEAMGSGSLTLVNVVPPARVEYVAEVADGRMRFEGTISVEASSSAPAGNGGSTVVWTERADLGWNPLLGWTALTLEDSQGRQLSTSLGRLKALVEQDRATPPTTGTSPERRVPGSSRSAASRATAFPSRRRAASPTAVASSRATP